MKQSTRRGLIGAAGGAAALAAVQAGAGQEEERRIVFQLIEEERERMAAVLANVTNVFAAYEAKGVPVRIRLVAYGPGLHLLRADTSPFAQRIEQLAFEFENLSLVACGNTRRGMEEAKGGPIDLLPEAELVEAGIVEIVELQREGWIYVRA